MGDSTTTASARAARNPIACGAPSVELLAAAMIACGGGTPPPAEPAAPEPIASAATIDAVAPDAADAGLADAGGPDVRAAMLPSVEGVLQAFNAHDAHKLAGYFADGTTVTAFGALEARGPDEVARAAEAFFAAFGDAKAVTLRAWIKGDIVVEETAWAGTMTGPFAGLAPTRKPVGQIRAEVFVLDGQGRVKELRAYGEDAGLLAQASGRKGAPPVPLLPVNPPGIHVAADTPEEEALAAWGRAGDAALSGGDPAEAAERFGADADDWVSFRGAPIRGKKALGKELAEWRKAFPDQKWTTISAWGIDGFAIVEHAMTGTQKGRLGALRGSKEPVTAWHWLTVAQPDGDQAIAHSWQHANLLELMKQTGQLEPAKPPPPAPAVKARREPAKH